MYDSDKFTGFTVFDEADVTDRSYEIVDDEDEKYQKQNGLRYSYIEPYEDDFLPEIDPAREFQWNLYIDAPDHKNNHQNDIDLFSCLATYPPLYRANFDPYLPFKDTPFPDPAVGIKGSGDYGYNRMMLDNALELSQSFHHSLFPETQTRLLRFHNQSYKRIRQYCLQTHTLFTDITFPPNHSSLNWVSKDGKPTSWKRIHELSSNPVFIASTGDTNFYLDQGKLGNCWFVAAATAITMRKRVFAWVVPTDQSTTHNYAGVFHFRFWVFGSWYDIVIDDFLPVDQASGKLIFAKNRENPNEFWSPLLEKAYAKLYGSYGNLDGGFTVDAFVDMTGGIGEVLNIKKRQNTLNDLLSHLFQSYRNKSLMGCNVASGAGESMKRLPNGLVKGHAYTVTQIASVRPLYDPSVTIHLIRIRNPWGNHIEWNGAWSDDSPEWNMLSESDKLRLNISVRKDGESWMSFDDFFENFDIINICHLTPNAFVDKNPDPNTFKQTMYYGEWVAYLTAGGSGSENPSSFWKNPQYVIRIRHSDNYGIAGKAALIISLMQMTWRGAEPGSNNEYIQFRLYKIRDDKYRMYKNKYSVDDLIRVGSSGPYTNMREVSKVFYVPVGLYVIIPSTFESDRENRFLLRIFTEKPLMSKYCQPQAMPFVTQYGQLRESASKPEDYQKVPWEVVISDLFLNDTTVRPSPRMLSDSTAEENVYARDPYTIRENLNAIDYHSLCSIM